ncbi:MAG TPA: sugar phosphate isomerase/epimerase [Phycisphaerales bacterium]|nr:sugar phosphate isomerase/epimerase [Phycisphaerales bacterium]HCD31046.1 sugar phosphate isomerase/epimerase [Phycisphaerales bacterium]
MMKQQRFETFNQQVADRFHAIELNDDASPLALSWSNWGFGIEPLEVSVKRLAVAKIKWIELHGNHYGANLGYRPQETSRILADHGVACSGICGMFSAENDLSSPSGVVRQRAVDYLHRTLDFAAEIKAHYILVVPGAVGRPKAYDASEFERSVDTVRLVADRFSALKIKAAIEPIRCAETSFCHTITDAQNYLKAVNHPGIGHINGDVYHMQSEESHIGLAILQAGEQLANLHLADSNRCALGDGAMDLDTLIRALYTIGFNRPGCFCTPEPLGPGGDPYPAMHGKPDTALLDALVHTSAQYFREREAVVRAEHAALCHDSTIA